jgi:hypothetical protein
VNGYTGDVNGAPYQAGPGGGQYKGTGSVLSNRILYQDQANNVFAQSHLRAAAGRLPATPVTLPLAVVEYHGLELTYQEMQPIYTGDVNAAPLPATSPGGWAQVRAAGRP